MLTKKIREFNMLISEQKMNQDVVRNSMLFWKASKGNVGKMESSNRIKDGNGSLVLGEDKVRRIWKDYFEDLYNVDIQEQVAVNTCGFDVIQRGNYIEGEPIRTAE